MIRVVLAGEITPAGEKVNGVDEHFNLRDGEGGNDPLGFIAAEQFPQAVKVADIAPQFGGNIAAVYQTEGFNNLLILEGFETFEASVNYCAMNH